LMKKAIAIRSLRWFDTQNWTVVAASRVLLAAATESVLLEDEDIMRNEVE
jgi:hypothetical protein